MGFTICQGCWTQTGSYWPQMGQIRDFSRSVLSQLKKSHICPMWGQSDPMWGKLWQPWHLFTSKWVEFTHLLGMWRIASTAWRSRSPRMGRLSTGRPRESRSQVGHYAAGGRSGRNLGSAGTRTRRGVGWRICQQCQIFTKLSQVGAKQGCRFSHFKSYLFFFFCVKKIQIRFLFI